MSILNTPELIAFQRKQDFLVSSMRYMSPNLIRAIPEEMKFSDITLKDLLNKITKIKRGGWAIRMSDFINYKDNKAIDIDI